mgnify:CR=1 FL=1
MGFKARFDVMWFRSGPYNSKSNRLVMLELKFQYCLHHSLAHCKPMLCFTLFDDAQTNGSVVSLHHSVQSEWNLHGTVHPHHVPYGHFQGPGFILSPHEHALNFILVVRATHHAHTFAHTHRFQFSCFIIRSTVATIVCVMESISRLTWSPILDVPKVVSLSVSGIR